MRLALALPDDWTASDAERWQRGALWCSVTKPVPAGTGDLALWARAMAEADAPPGSSVQVLAEERWQTDDGWPFVLAYRECVILGPGPGPGCVEARYIAAYQIFDLRCAAIVAAPDRQALDREGVSALALLQSARPVFPACLSVVGWLEG